MQKIEKNSRETPGLHIARLGQPEFNRLSRFIYDELGIKMPPQKRTMLESRLHKRLRALELSDFKEYCEYLFSDEGKRYELVYMVNEVTTNKTDFYREPSHFEYLGNALLPQLLKDDPTLQLKIWSAGCSSGEEVYTLAMVLEECRYRLTGNWDYRILGTDISTDVLQKAITAIYPMERVEHLPLPIKKRYMLKSKDSNKPMIRMKPGIRIKARYQRLNLMESVYRIPDYFDIVFCRNVLIYFDKETQQMVLERLLDRMNTGSALFIGHSESIGHFDLPVKQIYPQVYKKI